MRTVRSLIVSPYVVVSHARPPPPPGATTHAWFQGSVPVKLSSDQAKVKSNICFDVCRFFFDLFLLSLGVNRPLEITFSLILFCSNTILAELVEWSI